MRRARLSVAVTSVNANQTRSGRPSIVKAISLSVVVSNKAKGRISNWVFQENKARQIFQKNERFLPLHTHFCLITDELDKIRKAFSSKSNLSQCSVGSTIFPLWTAPEVNDEEGSHASRFYRWFFQKVYKSCLLSFTFLAFFLSCYWLFAQIN